MFIHAKNASSERIIKVPSCPNCSIESAFFGVGANKALVFPDYSAHSILTLLLPFSKALHLKAFPDTDSCLTQSSLQLKLFIQA